MARLKTEFEATCPCCGAVLVIDRELGRVIQHREPPHGERPELSDAQRILAEQEARRNAIFEQSLEDHKSRGDALARRFEEALKEAKKEPVSKPLRGFDLD